MSEQHLADPADPVPLPRPAVHLASRWAEGRSTPHFLKPLAIVAFLATTCAAAGFVWRARTMAVTVVPAESALTDVAIRALPDDNVLKDFMKFIIASSESWTPDSLFEVERSTNDFIYPTFRDDYRRRLKRLILDVGTLPRAQSAILLVTRIAERNEGTAYVDSAVLVQTFVYSGNEPRLSRSEIRIYTAEIIADVATDHNRPGLLLRNWRNQNEQQWAKAKLPRFWDDEFSRHRSERIQRVLDGKEDSSP